MTEPIEHADYPIVDDRTRAQNLSYVVAGLSRSARVESQSQFNATLVRGQKPNHVLHAILTIFTCLLWGIIWIIISATSKETRLSVMVDDYGRVYVSQNGQAWVEQPAYRT